MARKDVLVFSRVKFEEYVRAHYSEKDFEIELDDSRGWSRKCEGLTPKEMYQLGYNCHKAWLVKRKINNDKK